MKNINYKNDFLGVCCHATSRVRFRLRSRNFDLIEIILDSEASTFISSY